MTRESSIQTQPALAGPTDLHFTDAALISYRLFDVADDIDLDRAQELLAGAGTRLRLTRERSEYLEIPHAPLTVHLGQREVRGEGGTVYQVDAHARLFNFGALSVRYELWLPDAISGAAAAALVRDLEGAKDVEVSARAEISRLCDRLRPAFDTPHLWHGVETYSILFARGIPDHAMIASLGEDPRIARILLAEPGSDPLSDDQVDDATHFHYSYAENDLCVLDWNAAVVVEPGGLRDIPDVLEFATAQLLEFRFYDDLVDREMENLYSILAPQREPLLWRIGGRYGRLGRQLNRRLLETVEFIERVDNSLKVVADTYLARIYNGALESFRVPSWIAAVNRKQDLTRQVAEVLANESQVHTSHLLEIVIILLILYEIIAPMVSKLMAS